MGTNYVFTLVILYIKIHRQSPPCFFFQIAKRPTSTGNSYIKQPLGDPRLIDSRVTSWKRLEHSSVRNIHERHCNLSLLEVLKQTLPHADVSFILLTTHSLKTEH